MFVVKYKEKDTDGKEIWGYISNVSQAAVKEINSELFLNRYNGAINFNPDPCAYVDGVKLPEEIANINKIFTIASNQINESAEGTTHIENLISNEYELSNPMYSIMLYIEDSKEFDNIALITDQDVYLMNEKGQTIERLA